MPLLLQLIFILNDLRKRPMSFPQLTATVAGLLLLASPALAQVAPASTRDTIQVAEIRVVGSVDALLAIPGSATLLDAGALLRSRVLTVNEALRRVPGVVARDEEGFGLRPNIGIRGLSPTRSAKVLLLEDGIPITFAPYGANETYYHPPVDRFERIEVLKGSGQILFGPQTIGGVINYVTPEIPREAGGLLTVAPGNRRYLNLQARYGARAGRAGFLAGYGRKVGSGARQNTGSELNDATLSGVLFPGRGHSVTARANYYAERSNVTYSGLTEAEYAADPRRNPFRNDSMRLDRWGASLTHRWPLGPLATLTTTFYGSTVSRDWWRQSSASDQRPNDASDSSCAGMANLNTTCGNQGRLRDYLVWGVEPRLKVTYPLLGAVAVMEAGVRAHAERQDRRQLNGSSPNARAAGPSTDANSGRVEDNVREATAWSAFVQQRLVAGRFTVTPGARLEHVRYRRTNRLPAVDVSGRTELTALVPGLGATYAPSDRLTLFAGAHRGFAPPRTEDVIDNATGATVDLDAELSWNFELGVRARPARSMSLEATAFRMDFENQVVPASVAGGAGAALTSAGRTLHQGVELAGRVALGRGRLYLEGSWTWLAVARFEGPRYGYVGTGGADVVGKVYAGQNGDGTRQRVSVSGNRLPYAPRGLLTAALGFAPTTAFDARVEVVRIGSQFGDALNTATLVPDGQQGPIPAATIWNAGANYTLAATRTTLFATVKNLFNLTYIADRTRGLLPGAPRMMQAGVSQAL
jgi:Fe(3+) dicitrate transport protein